MMDDQMSQLLDVIKEMNTRTNLPSALLVDFPVFSGNVSEDVRDFVDSFKRAAIVNGWSEANLVVGLPLFRKGHANAWFKSLEGADDMTFVELASALIDHFASGANQ